MNWKNYYQQRLNDPAVISFIRDNCMGGLPKSYGTWSGEPGNSEFVHDQSVIPPNREYSNMFGMTYAQIYKKYGLKNQITFVNGGIKFPEEVILIRENNLDLYRECYKFKDMRSAIHRRLHYVGAKIKGMSYEEFTQWKDERNMTWHEDPYTGEFQLIMSEIHGNITHQGHIAIFQSLVQNGLIKLEDPT